MAMVVNPIFRGTMLIIIEAKAMAMDLNNSEDAVVVGPTIRITMEHISTSIIHMIHNQNNMVLPAVYVAPIPAEQFISVMGTMTTPMSPHK